MSIKSLMNQVQFAQERTERLQNMKTKIDLTGDERKLEVVEKIRAKFFKFSERELNLKFTKLVDVFSTSLNRRYPKFSKTTLKNLLLNKTYCSDAYGEILNDIMVSHVQLTMTTKMYTPNIQIKDLIRIRETKRDDALGFKNYTTYQRQLWWKVFSDWFKNDYQTVCQHCGASHTTSHPLCVHHKGYAGGDIFYNEHLHLDDLETLCDSCHVSRHRQMQINGIDPNIIGYSAKSKTIYDVIDFTMNAIDAKAL